MLAPNGSWSSKSHVSNYLKYVDIVGGIRPCYASHNCKQGKENSMDHESFGLWACFSFTFNFGAYRKFPLPNLFSIISWIMRITRYAPTSSQISWFFAPYVIRAAQPSIEGVNWTKVFRSANQLEPSHIPARIRLSASSSCNDRDLRRNQSHHKREWFPI